jgi:hypothetical protein
MNQTVNELMLSLEDDIITHLGALESLSELTRRENEDNTLPALFDVLANSAYRLVETSQHNREMVASGNIKLDDETPPASKESHHPEVATQTEDYIAADTGAHSAPPQHLVNQ